MKLSRDPELEIEVTLFAAVLFVVDCGKPPGRTTLLEGIRLLLGEYEDEVVRQGSFSFNALELPFWLIVPCGLKFLEAIMEVCWWVVVCGWMRLFETRL